MQHLLAELLWNNSELSTKAIHIRQNMPGFTAAKRSYDEARDKLRTAVGYDLYDQFMCQLGRYLEYEDLSYYALGLGLREAFIRELGCSYRS